MITTTAVMIMLFFSKKLQWTIGLMFVAGMATSGRMLCGYVYGNEFFTPRWQVVYGTMFIFMDGISILTSAMYYDWVNKHYINFALIGVVLAVINLAGLVILIPESPLWLLKQGKIKEAQEGLRKIHSMNGGGETDIEIEMLGKIEEIVKVNYTELLASGDMLQDD